MVQERPIRIEHRLAAILAADVVDILASCTAMRRQRMSN